MASDDAPPKPLKPDSLADTVAPVEDAVSDSIELDETIGPARLLDPGESGPVGTTGLERTMAPPPGMDLTGSVELDATMAPPPGLDPSGSIELDATVGPARLIAPPAKILDPSRHTAPATPSGDARRNAAPVRLMSGAPTRPLLEPGVGGLKRGASVGRYLVLNRLGAGGMGVVYAAYDPELDRKVAVKLLHGGPAGTSDDARARLLREAQAMAQLSHPNVIAVYDVGTHDDGVFIAMELVEGESLGQWLTSQQRSWREIVRIFAAAGRGLEAAHAAQLIHRDFKPDNALVGVDGRIRVLDFGLARLASPPAEDEKAELRSTLQGASAASRSEGGGEGGGAGGGEGEGAGEGGGEGEGEGDEDKSDEDKSDEIVGSGYRALSHGLTYAGAVMGTPAYMAPEQFVGERTDERTDQFNFCASLYEALYGEIPFAGDTFGELRRNVVSGVVRDPPPGKAVPPWLRRVVLGGLKPRPEDRHSSMNALITLIQKDPGRRMRNVVLAALAVVVGVGGYALAMTRPDPALVCAGMDAHLAGVWDDAARAAGARSFADTGSPLQAEAWSRTAGALDGYADRWVALRAETCEAFEVRKEDSTELHERRMACLDRGLRSMGALVGVYAAADVEIVEHAFDAVATLPSLDVCADRTALMAGWADPPDPGIAPRVTALEAELAAVLALFEAGKYDEARRRVDSVVVESGSLGYAPLKARALLRLGFLQLAQGQTDDAEESLWDSIRTAEGARDDDTAARAWIHLVYLVAGAREDPKTARRWSLHAAVALGRRGAEPELEASLHRNTGYALAGLGRYADAVARYEKALAILTAAHGADHPSLSPIYGSLGNVYLQEGKYAEALLMQEKALAVKEAAVGPEHPQVALILTNLGNVLTRLARYDEARAAYERALSIHEKAYGPENHKMMGVLGALAILEGRDGHHAEAVKAHRRVLDIKRKTLDKDHASITRSMNNLGNSLIEVGEVTEAEEVLRAVLERYERMYGSDHPKVAIGHNNLCRALRGGKKLDEALVHCERALEIREAKLDADHPHIGYAAHYIGLVHLDAERPRSAIAPLERAVAIRAAKEADPADLGDTRFALARALWDGGGDRDRSRSLAERARVDFSEAGEKRTEALAILDEWLDQHRLE